MRLALQRGGEGRADGNISSLSLNKIEDAGELPGLMIEEMMESASMVNGDDTGKATKDNGPVCLLISHLIILRIFSDYSQIILRLYNFIRRMLAQC